MKLYQELKRPFMLLMRKMSESLLVLQIIIQLQMGLTLLIQLLKMIILLSHDDALCTWIGQCNVYGYVLLHEIKPPKFVCTKCICVWEVVLFIAKLIYIPLCTVIVSH